MRVVNHTVEFHKSDLHFVGKFGVMEATEMVLDFYACNRHPFIYDTHQLAAFFYTRRKDCFYIWRHIDEFYADFTLRKRNGELRYIKAPFGMLKHMQDCILRYILSVMPISEYATAYRVGGRLKNNAEPHIGKKYLLKMDLKDFFGSIRFDQVYAAAFNTKFFPTQIGTILTKICCYKDVLPQGAPTSPTLSNLVLRHFDDAIGAWCKKRKIAYTRYCDDLTFSGDTSLYPVYVKAKSMLENMGFELNARKTHFVTNAARQSVTGLTVNDKVTVSASYKRLLRQECHYALKYGFKNAILYAMRADFIRDGEILESKYRNHLLGRVRYVLQIEPENTAFQKYLVELKNREE